MKVLIALLALLVVVLSYGVFTVTQQTADPAPVDNTEYELLVCMTSEGKPIYQGLVDIFHFTNTRVRFTEEGGLSRSIVNATCVLTTGTQAQFKAAEEANGTNIEEVPPVDETQSGS